MSKINIFSIRKGFFVILVAAILAHDGNADEVPAFFLKIAKNLPRIGRSAPNEMFFDKNADDYHVSNIAKRKIGFHSETDTRAWQNFPLSIEGPPELWRTLASYSQDPLYRASDDFNNELWTRDKRTNIQQE